MQRFRKRGRGGKKNTEQSSPTSESTRSEARFKETGGNERPDPSAKSETGTDSDEIPSQEEINKMSKKQQQKLMLKYPKHFRISGAFFGNLNAIRIDKHDIKATHVCFNCLQKNCQRNICPMPVKFMFCHNCGRRGVSMKTCPRCKDAHAERQKKKQLMELQSRNSNQLFDVLKERREQTSLLTRDDKYNNVMYPLMGVQTYKTMQDNFMTPMVSNVWNENMQDYARLAVAYDQRNENASDPSRSLMRYDQNIERMRDRAWSPTITYDHNIERMRDHTWPQTTYDQNIERMRDRTWPQTTYDQNIERMRDRTWSPTIAYDQNIERMINRSRSPIRYDQINEMARERSRSPISFSERIERMREQDRSRSPIIYNERNGIRQQQSRYTEDENINSSHVNHRSNDQFGTSASGGSQKDDRLSLLLYLTSSMKGMDPEVRTLVLREAGQSEEKLKKLVILAEDLIDLDLEVRMEMLRSALSR